MKYQLLIFDWDGTLVDSSAYIVSSIQQIAATLNLPVPIDTEVRGIIGLGSMEAYCRLFPSAEHLYVEFVQLYQAMTLQAVATKEVLFTGVKDMLAQLKCQGYLLAIATGKSRMKLNASLQQLELKDTFAATRCADETRSKPHRQMIDELLCELAVIPKHALLIGDTEYDMQLAQNAGIDAIAVGCGAQPLKQLMLYKPLATIAHTCYLTAWLSKQLSG